MKPFTPMSPILTDELPHVEGWGYQLKWDGYRTIAMVDQGQVELYSKRMLFKNAKYPDLVEALSQLKGTFLLDGELVVMDAETNRPSFQKMQQRDKLTDPRLITRGAERAPVQYIIFDLLQLGQEDLRKRPFGERHERLKALAADWGPPFFLTDLFEDGETLWAWVNANGWEGVVSKKLSSPYREGKEHHDWLKKKTMLRLEIEAVGILMKEGRVSSLVMRRDGEYLGRVSSGLNDKWRRWLFDLPADRAFTDYFTSLPEDLKGMKVRWLNKTFTCEVSGQEITEGGAVRHPKLLSLGGNLL
ncbi:DNA ligase [Paenibacillus sp. GP183]|uniref:ATP-dependent DNA ligase n=1 Tax=Paenibacillus sp. GP183 TaxID=1882751 RepID=UPI00089BE454|nr:DNA ligase [Paenibacillus sp. GP183]SEC55315.1 bifunctional non-homologous end joining protein LigD [Paenibacillus sp. GP183]